MDYITRDLERKFLKMNSFFKVVLVTGARQVGKTTMLKHLAQGHARTYVTLDNLQARELAKEDPVMFFQAYKPPIIIDEIQYAPELFSQIKIMCDESEELGRFWLTGSQQYNVMKNVRETLAGRIGILNLYSLSQSEKLRVRYTDELDFSFVELQKRMHTVSKNDVVQVFEHIWQGGMPQVIHADTEERNEYFEGYINSYLMRDVAELGGVTDTLRFGKFLTCAAALIGEQVNYKTLSDATNISQPTAKEWLRLLEGLGVIYLLQPYANNALKRLSKTSKLYFCDTGLAAFLSMWPTYETLLNGAASGKYFENYVVAELLKGYSYSPSKVNMTYYRDSNAKEVDLFVEKGNFIHPLEIKKSANPDRREIRKFTVLESANIEIGSGGIICLSEELLPIDESNCIIPCNLL